ncbi:protein-L-isoaspartate O-methyltransferase [Mycena rebaudengoi]|nr:protein-L-isoaspartate O-methyltransferase [Mycena rebaudengoi]
MAWRCSGKTNRELVENMVKSKIMKSPEAQAMQAVDRAHYVLDKSAAYDDRPQSVGHGATRSAPHMHAYAVEYLLPFLHPGAKVLDIGSESGYLCAVLHHLVSPAADTAESSGGLGKVIGIEHVTELVDWSLQNLKRDERTRLALENKQIEVFAGDGRLGKHYTHLLGPYDAIHVGAAAPTIPESLIAQLARPGRMFIPVGTHSQCIMQVDKDQDGSVTKEVMAMSYVPLMDREKQKPW